MTATLVERSARATRGRACQYCLLRPADLDCRAGWTLTRFEYGRAVDSGRRGAPGRSILLVTGKARVHCMAERCRPCAEHHAREASRKSARAWWLAGAALVAVASLIGLAGGLPSFQAGGVVLMGGLALATLPGAPRVRASAGGSTRPAPRSLRDPANGPSERVSEVRVLGASSARRELVDASTWQCIT